MRSGVGWLVVIAMVGCGGPRAAESEHGLLAGQRALSMGDPAGAVRILAAIPSSDPDHAKAITALAQARAEMEAVAGVWLDQIDGLIKNEDFTTAEQWCGYLSDRFSMSDALAALVATRRQQITQGKATAKKKLSDLDQKADEAFLKNDLVAAKDAVQKASALAWRLDPEHALDREERLATAELRAKGSKQDGAIEQPPEPEEAKAAPSKTRRPPAKAKKSDKTEKRAEPEEPSEEAAAEASANDAKVMDLLRSAAKNVQKKSYFLAIVGYMAVLELDAKNETAKGALASLEARRQQLIHEYLQTANGHFVKQDLESAVPYFQKVLQLDKNNEQAIEGLKMHDNLERIRGAAPK